MKLLNARFAPVTERDTVEWARRFLHTGKSGYITTVNVAILMMMRSRPRLQRFIDGATLTVADGQPLVWLSKLLERPLPERVAGVELVESLCRCAAEENASVFLLGSTSEVVAKVAAKLKQQNPTLRIVGVENGYFDRNKAAVKADQVRDSKANLLFVAMGVPRQEEFLEENWERLGVNLAIPVGGSFDVIAGCKRRAPEWIQKIGFEWLYRLCQEPKRLAKRYLITNCQFLFLAFFALLKVMPQQFVEATSQSQQRPV